MDVSDLVNLDFRHLDDAINGKYLAPSSQLLFRIFAVGAGNIHSRPFGMESQAVGPTHILPHSSPHFLHYRLRKSTGDPRYWAPLDRRGDSLWSAIAVSCYRPFRAFISTCCLHVMDYLE